MIIIDEPEMHLNTEFNELQANKPSKKITKQIEETHELEVA